MKISEMLSAEGFKKIDKVTIRISDVLGSKSIMKVRGFTNFLDYEKAKDIECQSVSISKECYTGDDGKVSTLIALYIHVSTSTDKYTDYRNSVSGFDNKANIYNVMPIRKVITEGHWDQILLRCRINSELAYKRFSVDKSRGDNDEDNILGKTALQLIPAGMWEEPGFVTYFKVSDMVNGKRRVIVDIETYMCNDLVLFIGNSDDVVIEEGEDNTDEI